MIPLVSSGEATTPIAGGSSLAIILRRMIDAWIAHHQRLADLGLSGSDL